jgi:sarcosine oxidase
MERRVAVIGAGIVGLSTAHALRALGATVRIYERGVPGAGQSGGEGRIFRHAHDDVRLVRLAEEARGIWREWEEEFGEELVSGDGAIALGEGALERLQILEKAGVAASEIGPDELAGALPILAPFDGPAVLDPGGGTIRTTAAIAALSAGLGEALVADDVLSVAPAGDAVEVRAGGETATFDAAVICGGRGTLALARSAGIALPVETAAHVRLTFDLAGEPPARLATLQDGSGAFPETGTYAATEPGNRRYGLGLSETTRVDVDGGLVDERGLPELAERAAAYVAEALPGLDPSPVGVRHCWVTRLPWGEDAVAVWQQASVFFVAGHNLFKLAPVLGRRLATAATGGEIDDVLRPEARLGAGA